MKTQPLLSFIVSVYNLERYIGECLDSILAQPFDNYEIVLVDNNSTDESKSICREYAASHQQIRYYELDGEPLMGRAGIYGLKVAHGKYVQFVDGDDLLAPNVYREIANVLREKEPDVLFGQFVTFSDSGVLNFTDVPYSAEAINGGGIDEAIDYLADRLPLHLPAWRVIPLRDKKCDDLPIPTSQAPINHDVFLNNSILMTAKTLHYIDKPMYLYRLRNSSISRISTAKQASEACKTLILHQALTALKGLSQQKKDYLLKVMDAWQYSLFAALSALDTDGLRQCTESMKNCDVHSLPSENGTRPDSKRFPFLAECLAGETEKGLKCLWETAGKTIGRLCQSLPAGDIYLAPTGNVGANMQAAFASHGVEISGFFDNDPNKNGAYLGGVPIRLPSAAAQAVAPITVVVASMYANVRRDLVNQFLSLGIQESSILEVEFHG